MEINEKALQKGINSVLRPYGLQTNYLSISQYDTSEGFYDKNDTIWEMVQEHDGYEKVEVNKARWAYYDLTINDDCVIADVPLFADIVDVDEFATEKQDEDDKEENDEEEDDDEDDEESELTLGKLRELNPSLYDECMDAIKEADWYKDIEDYASDIFSDYHEYETLNIIEDMAYWTIYFQPRVENEDIAFQCRLTPFEYEGEMYLCLAGCGMDLSPKLDAYQALTIGTVPPSSEFIRQPNYAKYVVGEETFNKVMKAITLEYPSISFSTNKSEKEPLENAYMAEDEDGIVSYVPREIGPQGNESYAVYFDLYDGKRHEWRCNANNIHEALGKFMMDNPSVRYEQIIDHCEL